VPAILVRLAVAGLAAAAILVGAHQLRDDGRCRDLTVLAATAPVARLPAIAERVVGRCGDPRERAAIALVMRARGGGPAAVTVATRMTQAAPDDYIGWFTVWRLTGDRRALASAHRLNPRGVPGR
jgi:hypothetical protein